MKASYEKRQKDNYIVLANNSAMLLYPYKESFQYKSIPPFCQKLSLPSPTHRLRTYSERAIGGLRNKNEQISHIAIKCCCRSRKNLNYVKSQIQTFENQLIFRQVLMFYQASILRIALRYLKHISQIINSSFFNFLVQQNHSSIKTANKMFKEQAIAKPCLTAPDFSEGVIVSSRIDLFNDGKTYKNAQAHLFDEWIYLAIKIDQQLHHYRIDFDFGLIFELLSSKSVDQRKQNIQSYDSIKLEKNQKCLELRNLANKSDITSWRTHLASKLNQRGFHELFRPLKELGRGNFASVYLVISHLDSKQYAIKAFSKEATYSEENGKESLINEITIMRKLHHKNLMKIFGVYESLNSIYVCVELLAGGQLYDKIKTKYRFTSHEIRSIMKSILSGLEALHSLNIMHRDLKPENILFRSRESKDDIECVIADFGLAESVDSEELMFHRCGTPGYVAPEIANQKSFKQRYNTSCDLFSLGIIFHLLILGKSPFPGKTFDEVLEQNKACKINFESFEYQQLPSTWLSLLRALLERDPKRRITATLALNHEFFKKEPLVGKYADKEKNKVSEEVKSSDCSFPKITKDKKTSMQCESPLMLTKNINRKQQGLLKDDSCLKFKMKENVIAGKGSEEGKEVTTFNTPVLLKPAAKLGQSRFKKMVDHNS